MNEWYWYRSTTPSRLMPDRTWTMLFVDAGEWPHDEAAGVSISLTDLHGEWRGPISEPMA